MIVGNEMQNIQTRAIRQIRQVILRQSGEGGELNDACKEALRLAVHNHVYNGYAGTVYTRRMEGGGLADEDNWLTTTLRSMLGARIDIEDRTPAGDNGMINPPPDPVFYLSDIIEAGANGRRWHDPDWPGPRPYMEIGVQEGCNDGGVVDNALAHVVNDADLSGV